ncbi:hypothetical protein ApDm4_0337 [Acetobacter pomorum]|nr:hypothetical protein ApDm4_0337 [Acetobacter pomorum]
MEREGVGRCYLAVARRVFSCLRGGRTQGALHPLPTTGICAVVLQNGTVHTLFSCNAG